MKNFLIAFAFTLSACSAAVSTVNAPTVGLDGNSLPSEITGTVDTIRNNAFLRAVSRPWSPGPTEDNTAGIALNTLSIGRLADIALADGGRIVTVTTYDMVSHIFKFQAAKNESEAYYTNETFYTNAIGVFKTVSYTGVKIDTAKGAANPSLILCDYSSSPNSGDFGTIVDQKTFDAFRDKFWTKELVDFTKPYAYIGDTGPGDSLFLSSVNKTWAKGENTSIGTEGAVTGITIGEGGLSIIVSFAGGGRYRFTFDSSAAGAGTAYYRYTYQIKNLYTVTRTIGIAVEGNMLNWYDYDHSSISGDTYEVALAAVNSQKEANQFNKKYHSRNLVSFDAAHMHANIGQI